MSLPNQLDPLGNRNVTTVRETRMEKTTPMLFDDSTFVGGLFKHVVWPKVIDLAFATGMAALEKVCYGSIGATKRSKPNYNGVYTYQDYQKISSSPVIPGSSLYGTADRHRNKTKGTKWYCEDLDQMDGVISEMQTRLIAGGKLSVADMFDIFDISDAPATSNNFGWTSLDGMQTYRDLDTPGQWVVEMPKPKDIKNI